MRYFFTRKLMLLKESDAFIVLPGGFGTLDEFYELLTLLQTGKAEPAPVVLLESPAGRSGTPGSASWTRRSNRAPGLRDDRAFFSVTDDVSVAATELLAFYRNYRSCRWVGDLLVLRMAHPTRTSPSWPTSTGGSRTSCSSGVIRKVDPLPPERADGDVVDLPRLALRFDKVHYGRLPSADRRGQRGARRRLRDGRRRWAWRPSDGTSGAGSGAAGRSDQKRSARGRLWAAGPGTRSGRPAPSRGGVPLREPACLVPSVGVDAPVLSSSLCEVHASRLPYVHLAFMFPSFR